jgi:hypothetical protein
VNAFDRQLAIGRVTEGLISKWVRARGYAILPAYEIEREHGKGPQLFAGDGSYVVPDMLAFNHNGIRWIEAKHKTVFSWHRNTKRWTTGIDRHHFQQYLLVQDRTKLPVVMLFYHCSATPNRRDRPYCRGLCPVGLFGGWLSVLAQKINHTCDALDKTREGYLGHGHHGMVYWAHETLELLATLEEIQAFIPGHNRAVRSTGNFGS